MSAESYDPFELFDKAAGADSCRNPYTEYAEARRQAPVRKVDTTGTQAPMLSSDKTEVYEVLSHEAVSQVLRDGKTFSSSAISSSRAWLIA